ncbi:hypothetical protein ACFLIM_41865 [Nonomuraea sp. M3C6]|uniref:Major facilitator superfamily (MFS) profile domain-containing protein n=1 Tax=Nonomuraea marmarensis TaxID=3351344 RepID=A0ABW7AUI7_9ACTN
MTRTTPLPTVLRTSGTVAMAACAAALLALINYTVPMVTVSEPAPTSARVAPVPAWILNAIALGLSALLLIASGLADDHGRKRDYVIGTWVLATGALMAGLSVNTLMFVTARLLQGRLRGRAGGLGHLCEHAQSPRSCTATLELIARSHTATVRPRHG